MPLRSETVIAAYRPKAGQAHALRKLVREHQATLHAAQLITSTPTILLRARSDGTLLEIFEWVSARAADEAHQHEAIRTVWKRLAAVADFVPLSAVKEAGKAFSHFEAVKVDSATAPNARAKRPQSERAKR